jgi:hypothetical protein
MVLEALSFGRHVLWSQDFQFTRQVTTYDDIERELFALLAQHRSGTLCAQHDAAAMIRERYGVDRCIRGITDAWGDAADGRRPTVIAEAT